MSNNITVQGFGGECNMDVWMRCNGTLVIYDPCIPKIWVGSARFNVESWTAEMKECAQAAEKYIAGARNQTQIHKQHLANSLRRAK